MKGKAKCKALKEIRKKIAEENNIEYIVSECTHKGDCKGTCPKCESEVRYLERELARREKLGKAVAVAGVAASVCLGLTACGSDSEKGCALPAKPKTGSETKKGNNRAGDGWRNLLGNDDYEIAGDIDVLDGEPVYYGPDEPEYDGGIADIDDGDDNGGDDIQELEGDAVYIPEEEE